MKTITGQVQYVNQPKEPLPGRKSGPGSVKLADGSYIKVWQRDLWQFTPGKTYEIECDEQEYQGTTQLLALKSKPLDKGNGAATGKPQTHVKPDTSTADAERIFICGAFNAAIGHGQIDIRDTAGMVECTMRLKEVFRRLQNPQVREDMDDEIPM